MKRKISATFSDGYVNTRTTNNPNLAFGYRVWSTDPTEQAYLDGLVRSAREGFRKDYASAQSFCLDSLEHFRGPVRNFKSVTAEVVAVRES